jgi:hypothetical protein
MACLRREFFNSPGNHVMTAERFVAPRIDILFK